MVADTPRAARGFCWEMQPLPLLDSTAGYPTSSSSAHAQGPVAVANQKGQKAPTDEEDVGLLLLLRGRRHARRHYRGDRLVVAYTPRARARGRATKPLEPRGSAGFVVADTPRAARGFCWEMQPLPLFDSTAGYPSLSSSARAQGPVAMANQKGTEGTQRGNRQRFPYEPRVIGGKLLMPAELQAIHPSLRGAMGGSW